MLPKTNYPTFTVKVTNLKEWQAFDMLMRLILTQIDKGNDTLFIPKDRLKEFAIRRTYPHKVYINDWTYGCGIEYDPLPNTRTKGVLLDIIDDWNMILSYCGLKEEDSSLQIELFKIKLEIYG